MKTLKRELLHRHAKSQTNANLGRSTGVGLVKYWPDFVFWTLPPCDCALMILLLETKLPGDLLVAGLVIVEVESVQGRQGLLSVPVLGVRHPATRLQHEWFIPISSDLYLPPLDLCPGPSTPALLQTEVRTHRWGSAACPSCSNWGSGRTPLGV